MKKIGKILSVIGKVLITLLIVFVISIPIVNNLYASRIKNNLKDIPLPENTEYVEALSEASKMTGNGNGMQYLGAILIKSELSLEELNSYYGTYRTDELDCLVERQEGQQIGFIEHGTLSFGTEMSSNGQYYIVYSWGNGIDPFSDLDIRGH